MLFFIAHPNGSLDKMPHTFTAKMVIYILQSTISKRLKELKATKKTAFTNTFQAQRHRELTYNSWSMCFLIDLRGSIQSPWRLVRCVQNRGTTTNVFRDFTDYICSDIEMNRVIPTDTHRIFRWDNLSAHHSTYVNQIVTGRAGLEQFLIVPRPPYHPMYGPIEYKICDLTHDMSVHKQPTWDSARLERAVHESAARIGPFNSTFDHCGF